MWDQYSTENVLAQYKKLQDNSIIMDIIDKDEHMSDMIRNPVDFRNVVEKMGYVDLKK